MFSTFRGERLLTELRSSDGEASRPETRKTLQRLIDLGAGVIPLVLAALGDASKRETMLLVEALTGLTNDKTLPKVAAGLGADNPRVVSAVSWALSNAVKLPTGAILDLLKDPDLGRPAVIEVISAQKDRFKVNDLLQAAHALESGDKSALFRIVGEIADESAVPDLLARIDGKSPLEYLTPETAARVRSAAIGLLRDPPRDLAGLHARWAGEFSS